MAGVPFDSRYMSLLGIKLVLFVVMIWIQLWQSQKLSGRVETAAAGDPGRLPALYRRFWITSALNMGFGVIMLALGLSLGRG